MGRGCCPSAVTEEFGRAHHTGRTLQERRCRRCGWSMIPCAQRRRFSISQTCKHFNDPQGLYFFNCPIVQLRSLSSAPFLRILFICITKSHTTSRQPYGIPIWRKFGLPPPFIRLHTPPSRPVTMSSHSRPVVSLASWHPAIRSAVPKWETVRGINTHQQCCKEIKPQLPIVIADGLVRSGLTWIVASMFGHRIHMI